MTAVHICRPAVVTTRKVLRCPTCKQRRRFVVRSYVWYPTDATCTACGDTWAEGERLQRPARRGWRVEASAAAKRDWEQATPAGEFRSALRRMVEAAL